jgi:Zn-dependent protease with chaperone function
MIRRYRRVDQLVTWLALVALIAMPLLAVGQTRVTAPKNKYQIEDDVKLGQQASQQVRQQMPLINDSYIDNYVESVGRRLVAAIPPEFQHPQFNYTFDVVNARDINAFALPGGPMFVNRGMIEAAKREGEMAGVMAHEISHVALRHATAQATETQKFQIGSVLGQILGGVVGGIPGAVIGAGSQIGFGAGALRYSRKYETQADILGAQIMARAGYDPRDLAEMFRTIESQGGGSGGPEWLSSHPNPGNRYERINQEAAMLRVNPNNAINNTREFQNVQARLRRGGSAPSMEEIARGGQRYPNQGGGTSQNGDYARGERIAYPSTNYRTERNNLFSVAIPSNWRTLGSGNSVSYAPEGAYGSNGITHGVMFSAEQARYRNLDQAAQEVLQGLLQSNNYLQQTGGWRRTSIDGRSALVTTLSGNSPITGQLENVTILVTQLSDGNVFYMAGVSPRNESGTYQRTFNEIARSLRLNG